MMQSAALQDRTSSMIRSNNLSTVLISSWKMRAFLSFHMDRHGIEIVPPALRGSPSGFKPPLFCGVGIFTRDGECRIGPAPQPAPDCVPAVHEQMIAILGVHMIDLA
jgi:hypothetical protein